MKRNSSVSFNRIIFALSIFSLLPSLPLFADTAAEEEITPGLIYREFVRDEGPFAIQVLELDRNTQDLDVMTALGRDRILGIEPLDSLIIRTNAKTFHGGMKMDVVAAINADFYVLARGPFQGDPVGLCIMNERLVSSPIHRSAALFGLDGTLAIGRYKFEASVKRMSGESFTINGVNQSCPRDGIVLITPFFGSKTRPQSGIVAVEVTESEFVDIEEPGAYNYCTVRTAASSDSIHAVPKNGNLLIGRGKGAAFLKSLNTGEKLNCPITIDPYPGVIRTAVGGTPRIVRGGKVSIEAGPEKISDAFITTRHPRTAFGYNDSTMFFVTVDGRRAGHSAGMSLNELADLMLELGATEALNLDGGGSTTMWVDGAIKNRPSDNRIRPISNALLIYRYAE